MKIASLASNNPISYGKQKYSLKQKAALLLSLVLAGSAKEIKADNGQYSYPVPIFQQAQPYYYPTPTPTKKVDYRAPVGSDFYYAILQYGDKYEIEYHYDPGKNGVGGYYQYGNMAFTKKEGKRISSPEKLYGFEPITEETAVPPTYYYNPPYYNPPYYNPPYYQSPYYGPYPPVYNQPATPTPAPTQKPTPKPTQKVDHRAPKGSDFYNAILKYGDKYKIQAHYDPGKGGIGTYYQYGPMAFDKSGKRISDTSKLYGFDHNIK